MVFRTVGYKIRQMRINAGFSQNELAERTQLSLRTIQRIENSETAPRGDSLKRISVALGITAQDLMSEEVLTGERTQTVQNQEKDDKWVTLALRISPLTYLINPLLAVLSPLVIWKLFEDKYSRLKPEGRKVTEIQLTWLIIVGLMYGYLAGVRLFHWKVPTTNETWLIFMPIALYYLNAFFITIEIIWWAVSKKRINGQAQGHRVA